MEAERSAQRISVNAIGEPHAPTHHRHCIRVRCQPVSASVGQLRTSINNLPANFTADETSTAWTFGGLASCPLTERVDLLARAGWFWWKTKANNAAAGYHAENTGTEPYWGAGVSYTMTPKAAISANWTRFKSAYASTDDADVFEIGMQYRF